MLDSYQCNIAQCKKISKDVYLIVLEAPEDKPFRYQAGQYLFIDMADNDSRPYSIASSLTDGRWLHLHIKDIPGNDFTGQVLERLQNSSDITVRLAAGKCTIDRSSGTRPLLFIAGGTGFANSHSIIQSLLQSDDSRPIHLYWGANATDEFYLQEKLELWTKEHDNFSYSPVINSDSEKHWRGKTGLVHEAVFADIAKLADFDIYLSGSSAMVFHIYQKLKAKDVPSDQIYSDMLDILRDKDELD